MTSFRYNGVYHKPKGIFICNTNWGDYATDADCHLQSVLTKKMPNGIFGQGSRREPLTKRKMGMQVLLDTVKYDVLYIF